MSKQVTNVSILALLLIWMTPIAKAPPDSSSGMTVIWIDEADRIDVTPAKKYTTDISEQLRTPLMQYMLRATLQGRLLMDHVASQSVGRPVTSDAVRREVESQLSSKPEYETIRQALVNLYAGIEAELRTVDGHEFGDQLSKLGKFWAREVMNKNIKIEDRADGTKMFVWSTLGSTPSPLPVYARSQAKEKLSAFVDAVEAVEVTRRGSENRPNFDAIIDTAGALFKDAGVAVKPFKGLEEIVVEPVQGKSQLNDLAFELARLPLLETVLRYNPSRLYQDKINGVFDIHAQMSWGGMRRVGAVTVGHLAVAYAGKLFDATTVHEVLHAAFASASMKGIETVFSGSITRSLSRSASTPYSKYMSFEELATWPLSLLLDAEDMMRVVDPAYKDAVYDRIKGRVSSAEGLTANTLTIIDQARAALASGGAELALGWEDFGGGNSDYRVNAVLTFQRHTDEVTIKFPLWTAHASTLFRRYLTELNSGDRDKADSTFAELKSLALERLDARAKTANKIRVGLRSISRIIDRDVRDQSAREALSQGIIDVFKAVKEPINEVSRNVLKGCPLLKSLIER